MRSYPWNSRASWPGTAIFLSPPPGLIEKLRIKAKSSRKNKAIYERPVVKRGGADFVSRAPAHPLRRRLQSIWPISDLSADELVVQPATHPLSPRPREIAPPRYRQCTKR